MEAIVFYPATETELNQVTDFARQHNLTFFKIDEDTKKRLAGIELSKLASKNPKAYATDDEIISVVEEAREERYGKGL
jgi:hypothetical protein